MAENAKSNAASIEALLPFLENVEENGLSLGEWRQPTSETPVCIELHVRSFISAVGELIQMLDDNGWVEAFD